MQILPNLSPLNYYSFCSMQFACLVISSNKLNIITKINHLFLLIFSFVSIISCFYYFDSIRPLIYHRGKTQTRINTGKARSEI